MSMKWLPLPKIAHGIVIYPFSPSSIQPPLNNNNANDTRPSSVASSLQLPNDDKSIRTSISSTYSFQQRLRQSKNMEDYSHMIRLEVGDDVYIIEHQGQWYRGYVCTIQEDGHKSNRAPIGIFPRNHVHVKEYIDIDPNESDALIHNRQHLNQDVWNYINLKSDMPVDLNRSFSESHIEARNSAQLSSFIRTGSLCNLNDQPTDLDNDDNGTSTHLPPPPLPNCRFDQSTLTGYAEPLVDEVAACITEWNNLFYTYLSQRDYQTFNFLKDNVYYLLQGRRQLLDQALSREEMIKLRKDIIQRMLTGNMELHGDMIIRHPEKGYLLDVKNTPLSTIYQLHWKYSTQDIATTSMSSNELAELDTSASTIAPQSTSNGDGLARNRSTSSLPTTSTTNANETSPQFNSVKFYHIYMVLNSFIAQVCQPGEFTELHFFLYSSISHKFVTEEYIMVLNYDGTPRDGTQMDKLQALFVDLSLRDITDGLYLVCHILRLGALKSNDNFYRYFGHFNGHNFLHRNNSLVEPSNTMCKRPFGCAVLKLTPLDYQKEPVQYDMPIYTPLSESNFTTLHEDIINDNSNVFRKNPQADKLIVTLQSFYGCIKDIVRVNAKLLQNTIHTLRIGFADVSFPNDCRNEMYIRLTEGDFMHFGRYRNIQVNMCVRDNETGEIIENAISVGSGKQSVTQWQSMIIYHDQRPKWNELVKIQIQDIKQWQRSHVFITVKHRSSHFNSSSGESSPAIKVSGSGNNRNSWFFQQSKETTNFGGGAEKTIAMGFLPIFLPPAHRDLVADGSHTICLYRYDPQLSSPQYYLNGIQWCSKSTAPINMTEQVDETKLARPTRQLYLGVSSPSNRSYKSSNGSFISSGSLHTAKSFGENQQMSINKLVPLPDKIYLNTFLCSTKFTQNKTLVKLLNWQTLVHKCEDGKSELLSVLDQFTFVGEVEVVKFLADIFDALLNIMVYHEDEDEAINREIHDQVLCSIVWLLGIVQDRRFSNFKPGLDVYLDQRFSTHPQEGSKLDKIATFKYFISSLTRLCENPGDPSKAKFLRSSMKTWSYLFRFIVRSRLYHQNIENIKEKSKNDELFKHDMGKLLAAITDIMSPEHPNSMIGTQTMALQHFGDILVELQKIFSCKQMMDTTVSFVDACSHVTGRLVGFKLIFILNIVKGQIFEDTSCKNDMAKHIFRWIKIWINCYTDTAKDVIFAKNAQPELNPQQQSRLPKVQWMENLRLSLTVMKELLNNVRKTTGMDSSGLTSSGIPSPVISNSSRPTSFCAINDDRDDGYQSDSSSITEQALGLVPQMLALYKDLQRLVTQAIQISNSPETDTSTVETNPNPRPQSRHSFVKLRERAISVNARTPLTPEIPQESQLGRTSSYFSAVHGSTTSTTADNKTKFNIILQALSTSPSTPFPYVFPFQPTAKVEPSKDLSDQTVMVTTGLLDLTVVFLELFYLVPSKQWIGYIENMLQQGGLENTADFLRKIVYTCMGMLFGDNILTLEESTLLADYMGRNEQDEFSARRRIPYHWLNLNAIAHKIILCNILDPIKLILELPEFIPSAMVYTTLRTGSASIHGDSVSGDGDNQNVEHLPALNEEPSSSSNVLPKPKSNNSTTIEEQRSALLLWRVYYVGFLRVVGSPRLDVTEFKPQTQRALWEHIHNLRGEYGAKTCLFLWNLAGKSGHAFTSTRGASDIEDNSRYNSYSLSDYFNQDNQSLFDYGYFSDVNPPRKSMASASEETDNYFSMQSSSISSQSVSGIGNQYSVRHSIRIAPTEEVPLKSINEEKNADLETNIPFLQVDLAHFILRPMSAASLTLHDRVRTNALSIIADIIAIELYSFGELVYVQKTLIGALDHFIMSDNKGDEELAARITSETSQLLSQRLQKDNRDDLQPIGRRIIESLSRLFSLLLQVRSLPADDDEYLDERIMATLRLMKFIQVIEREEIYVKYVHQLVQVHLDNNSYVEAALTLRLHSDLLLWDTNEMLAAIPELDLPVQSSFDRKEKLYLTMLQYLDKGSDWEICITLCKELAYEYEHTQFDYTKLSNILKRQATFTDNISKKERCFTEYFRVGFYGRGFPASNRNRQYIYRGLEWEKLNAFVERMQNRHPTAKILPRKIANSISLSEEQLKEIDSTLDGKYIQITPVTPIPDQRMIPCLSNQNAPESVKKYYEFNNVNKFVFTRVITKETDGVDTQPESDFLNLWTEKINLECEDKFPAIVKRSKIVKVDSALISPIENAVETVENKNRELISLEKKYEAYVPKNVLVPRQPVNISPFSMSLNGAVDAPVNGGLPLYKKAFLSKEYWENNSDMRQWITRLQKVILDQVIIIRKCLETHDLLVSPEMRPFHTTLVEFFNKNFASEIKELTEKPNKEEAKEKRVSSIITNRRRSTLSSATDSNSVYSHHYQQAYDDPKSSTVAKRLFS